MSDLSRVAVNRALAALRVASDGDETDTRAKAFVDGAKALMLASGNGEAHRLLREHPNRLIAKAATDPSVLTHSEWGSGDVATLAAAFVGSIEQPDLLSAIARYGRTIPPQASHVIVATGYTAGTTAETGPKAVKRLSLVGAQKAPTKAASTVVFSNELLRAGGEAVERLFRIELERAVTRGTNAAVIAELASAPTTAVPATSDAVADLRAAIAASMASDGYVVAAPAGFAADLALRAENRGAGLRGGEFSKGLEIVAVDGLPRPLVIPASLIAVHDFGVKLRRAAHATIQMDDAPDSPATASTAMVSLWQNNLVGLLAERSMRLILGNATIVEIGE